MAGRGTAKTVDELLAQARAMLPHRPSPAEALHAQARGALLVDIRGDDQRRDGLIPGAIVVPRNSGALRPRRRRHPPSPAGTCTSSSSATRATNPACAATLQQLGLIHATIPGMAEDSPPGPQPACP